MACLTGGWEPEPRVVAVDKSRFDPGLAAFEALCFRGPVVLRPWSVADLARVASVDSRTGLPRVGMIGGGQLARMTHQAAIAFGQSLRILATAEDDAAAVVAADVEIGSHLDLAALERFAADCDVVTFDHEHVPGEHIRALTAAGHQVWPDADALQFAQDKAAMRRRLRELGVPVPDFVVIDHDSRDVNKNGSENGSGNASLDVLTEFAAAEWPVVLKTASGGYDGRGVWVLADAGEAVEILAQLPSQSLVAERLVPLRRELAAVVARSPFGQAAAWPVVETVQQQGICVEVIAPAPGLAEAIANAATALALRIAEQLGVVGILAVELFEVTPTPQAPQGLVVNELAMRPHNSGHWTMNGSLTSQFEQHLRAVLDYPLGRTDALAPYTVMANVLGGGSEATDGHVPSVDERVHHLSARFPGVKIHLYGKGFRPGRKLGHVNVLGADLPALRSTARLAAEYLGSGVWPDGWDPHGSMADGAPAPLGHRQEGVRP